MNNISQLLDDWEAGKPVKIPYHQGMGHRWARAYYSQQPEILCAIIGHKISGLIDEQGLCECFRCGGKFGVFRGNISLYEFLWLAPIWKIKQWMRR